MCHHLLPGPSCTPRSAGSTRQHRYSSLTPSVGAGAGAAGGGGRGGGGGRDGEGAGGGDVGTGKCDILVVVM